MLDQNQIRMHMVLAANYMIASSVGNFTLTELILLLELRPKEATDMYRVWQDDEQSRIDTVGQVALSGNSLKPATYQ